MARSPDIVIIGSGIGGATIAAALAGADASVLVLERGHQLVDSPQARDARAIFVEGHYRPMETWVDHTGTSFNPGNYYCVGGNSKFYGAVHYRYRAQDFLQTLHFGGVSPAWPFGYDELEPWYCRAEALYQVRGSLGADPTEPPHSQPYAHGPVADEPDIARVKERLLSVGLTPAPLPLAIDIDRWLARGNDPWDAYPDTRSGKMDAETCGLAKALKSKNVTLATGVMVETLEASPDGRKIIAVNTTAQGAAARITPKLVILSAGAVNSAALLLRSARGAMPHGLANRSGQVGRNFMNHNTMAMMAIDPACKNRAVYQKTLGLNDFYLADEKRG
ncbi:MAG: FAD-dependent oxidoreductase, partial [Alphaproteobacteria bacterium]